MLNTDVELSPEAQNIIDKVEKLLRLAARNTNEAEAASATAKAMDMLADYGISMETVKQNSGEGGRRVDESLKGGHHAFQRDLWRAVAELNFCMYWSMIVPVRKRKWVPNKTNTGMVAEYTVSNTRQHRVVGKLVNARSTKVMAEYLEQAIDRALQKVCDETGKDFRSKWGNSFREGAADLVIEKIKARRRERMEEDRRKAQEAADAQETAQNEGVGEGYSTGRALTVASITESEKEANLDFLYGEGWCAKQRKEEMEREQYWAKYYAEQEARQQKWREENPEEAARQDEEARKENERYRKEEERRQAKRDYYWRTKGQYTQGRAAPAYKGDRSAYREGREAARNISIDRQTEGGTKGRAIG